MKEDVIYNVGKCSIWPYAAAVSGILALRLSCTNALNCLVIGRAGTVSLQMKRRHPQPLQIKASFDCPARRFTGKRLIMLLANLLSSMSFIN